MAKELPYFKFEPSQWDTGNIQLCSREDKGLFIDICSIYWQRLGDLPLKLAVQKLCAGNATALNPLIESEIIKVIDGLICIDFLNEQLSGFENVSEQNSKNALEGWKKRRKNATALNPQSGNNAIREEEIRLDKKKEDKSVTPSRDFEWFKSQIDAIWSDQLPTEKKQNLGRAIEESWLHLSANKFELASIDGAGCKRLVNSWLSKMKPQSPKPIHTNRLDLSKI